MSKRCLKCGFTSHDSANFCSNCGSNQFTNIYSTSGMQNPGNAQNTPMYRQPGYFQNTYRNAGQNNNANYGYNNQSSYQNRYGTVGSPINTQIKGKVTPLPKEKAKPWQILLLVVGCVVITLVSSLLTSTSFHYVPDNNSGISIIAEEESTTDYTKGHISDDGKYINEWAELYLSIPDDYINGDQEQYTSYDSDISECGLYIYSARNSYEDNTLIVDFVDLSSLGDFSYTAEDYLSVMISEEKEAYEEELPGYDISSSNGYDVRKIGSRDYLTGHVTISFDGGEVYRCHYVRVLSGRIIDISTITDTLEQSEQLISLFE